MLHLATVIRPPFALALTALLMSAPRGAHALDRQDRTRVIPSVSVAQRDPSVDVAAREAPASGDRSKRRVRKTTAATRTNVRYMAPRGEDALAADLTSLLRAKVRSGHWGVMVVSLSRGDTLFSLNPGERLLPASTMKLYTTALAFDRLGPQYQLTTDVLHDGTVGPDGTLQGNLYLRGGGDPSLSNRLSRGVADAPMTLLAKQIAAAGVRRVHGDLIGDESAFDAKRIPDGWLKRYSEAGYAARISALSLNENLATVIVGAASSGKASVTLDPPSSTIPVVNNVNVVAGSRGSKLYIHRLKDGRIEAKGWIGARSEPRGYQLVVDDPALFTTGALYSALAAEGITVDGQAKTGRTSPSAVRLTSLASPPLAKLASLMNRESINHYAELIFRSVAHVAAPDQVGSAEQGSALLRKFLSDKAGVSPGDVAASDGSGLSTLDAVTARSEVLLLGYANRAPWAADFHATLPVAGESELLKRRMKYTPAQGNLHAKTGTTNDVIALGGYVTAHNGEVLAFSFIYNGRDRWNAKDAIDLSGATLASFER
jgi:D-alanyl-D-alanine carboxypeptidase/D-alanyl-D-alanine-endopeptidase (penicillin-binding protein 4)